jgi:hypothetical protein
MWRRLLVRASGLYYPCVRHGHMVVGMGMAVHTLCAIVTTEVGCRVTSQVGLFG